MQYEDIDIPNINSSSVHYVKDVDGSFRMIFKQGSHVFKIWNAKYPPAKTFLDAAEAGFFDEIAKIDYLIFDKDNNCRGYVSPIGKPIRREDLAEELVEYKINKRSCYCFWHINLPIFLDLLEKIESINF